MADSKTDDSTDKTISADGAVSVDDAANATTADAKSSTVDAPTDGVQGDDAAAAPKAKTSSRSRSSKSSAASTDDSDPKLKCAACGKTAVFTEHSNVGGRVDLTYHDCEGARELVHEYAVAQARDPEAPVPTLAV